MDKRTRFGLHFARAVLFLLVAIHFVLPFTPANTHPERRILVASMILGAIFLACVITSYRRPFASFAAALSVLLLVYVISAVSGTSPIAEGLVVKIVFAAGLIYGLASARLVDGSRLIPISRVGVIDREDESR